MKLNRRVKQASRSLECRRQTLGRQWHEMPCRPRGRTLLRGALALAFVAGFIGRRLRPAVVAALASKAAGAISRFGTILKLVPVPSPRR